MRKIHSYWHQYLPNNPETDINDRCIDCGEPMDMHDDGECPLHIDLDGSIYEE